MVVVFPGLEFVEPASGPAGAGSSHKNPNLGVSLTLQHLSQLGKDPLDLTLPALELCLPAEESMIIIAFKSVWSFTPHPQPPRDGDQEEIPKGDPVPFSEGCALSSH